MHSQFRPLLSFPIWIHAFAWGGVLALILLLLAISNRYDGTNVWSNWTASQELRKPGYAERIYPENVLRTRANSWSNLAYVLVGFYAVGLAGHDWRGRPQARGCYLSDTPAMSIFFGLTCCYLGFGSGLYHASLSRWGQQIDVASMYAPLLAFIAINLGRWIPRVKTAGRREGFSTWPLLALLALVASFLLYQYKWSMSSAKVLPTLILMVAAFAVLDRFRSGTRMAGRWLVLSMAALVAARICWQLDVAKKFSGPDTWFQGHAVWHLLTALSLASTYLFYRSEINSAKTIGSIEPD